MGEFFIIGPALEKVGDYNETIILSLISFVKRFIKLLYTSLKRYTLHAFRDSRV